ncbi:mutS protein 5-like [Asbolus verrucosus]|uniref:MutS protein 5-like n=1 Tax=Asbolus verrucosus TaxID=1661398 RepID=A0A482WBQ9_ASBVE|nr:mutS protein 5-like [Asbolus verrucosus]
MGAAYFNFNDKLLYVYEEVVDFGPQFFVTRSLYREVNPKYILSFGNVNDEYIKVLIDTISPAADITTTTDTARSLPPNLFLLSVREYPFETCRALLSEMTLSIDADNTEVEKELHINSLINFDYKLSVYAAGALIKYLDKNWAYFTSDRDDLQFLHIYQISMKGHVLMDWTTLNALQVFQQCSHDASFKRGLQSSNREGLSVFRLFSSSCKSRLGHACLKNILMQPLNDMNELNKRLNFITFILNPGHQDFIESLQDNIKSLSDISSIYHTVFVSELGTPYKDHCELLNEFHNSVTAELIGLENSISNAIDFSDTKAFGRPVIKLGLDQHLDAKKLRRQDIAKHVTAAAKIAVDQLPNYLHECAIVYLPEMGHLIAIKEWEPNCNPEELKELGFQFMFTLRGTIHYKNPLCLELDESLGDINAEIIAHENRILQRLSSFVLKYNKDIREPLRILALIDALIAMAKVSAQNNYVRPNLNNQNVHEIQDCRHPLLELVSNFESNDFYSGKDYSHIKVITGPNGSGKSIYLKQVALAIYLAHIGSYVPAKTANISMMHSIHSRMQATESASVRLSAFMIDVIQATQAIHNGKSNSLILLDEFGRGTIKDEGFALLTGVLKKFQEKEELCPHILVSTHHQMIINYLPQSRLVDHLKMAHSKENGMLLYLYKITKGVSSSFAFDIAVEVGLDEAIVQRARELFKNNTIQPLDNYAKYTNFGSEGELIDFLKNVNISEPNANN